MVDILILKPDTEGNGSTFGLEGIEKTSGLRQLIQTISIEFVREINDLLGVGADGWNIPASKDKAEAKAKSLEATSRARRNIVRNQKNNGTKLLLSETLSNLEFVKITSESGGAYVVELRVTTAAGESTTLTF